MADDIGVFITGARELDLKFDQFPQSAHRNLRQRIDGLTTELYARVEAAIPKRTGRLAGEVSKALRDKPERITGVISISAEFAKAGALEYGAHRTAPVKAHAMRLMHLWGRPAPSPLTVEVPAHARTPNIEAERFMRGSIEGMRAEVEAALRQALDQTIEQT